jgi:multidrug efflux pump subunit AcrB
MNLIHRSLRRPITVVVVILGVVLCAGLALVRMPKDILPDLGVPAIYVAQPYAGMDPVQMEEYLTYFFEYNFLYVSGVEHSESKNIQGVSLIKLQFHPGTEMGRAMSEVINFSHRALALMPPGVVAPFILRFDAGSEPVGKLVFTSPKRSLGELQDYAEDRVLPLFATLPGVSAPPPFGSSPRTIVINADPDKLRRYNLSPYDVAKMVSSSNKIAASGNIKVGNLYPIVKVNSSISEISELENVPLRLGTYPTVFLKDVATVEDSVDLQTGYALIHGQRKIYIPVVKRFDASTLDVVRAVKSNIHRFEEVLPDDIKVTYEFDESVAVTEAIHSLSIEGLLGALLTGLMVLLFLRSWRSALIVTVNIPLALAGAITGLWLTGQTINIMTLGGLALAIGILVDETTITIENIHTHLGLGKGLARAVLDATNEMIVPCLLTMLCVLAVFTPAFFMEGVARSLFEPLSLAVGFAILTSFFLARSFVPVLSTWILPDSKGDHGHHESPLFDKLQSRYAKILRAGMKVRPGILVAYTGAVALLLAVLIPHIGQEIFPRIDSLGFQVRMRAQTGTYVDRTEELTRKLQAILEREAGPQNFDSSTAFVGTVVGSSANNVVYYWSSGPQESTVEVFLKPGNHLDVPLLQERLRRVVASELPDVTVSFEPSGILNRVMSQGAPSPIVISVAGPNLGNDRMFAKRVYEALAKLPYLRDLSYGQVFDYPEVAVNIDRREAGIRGFSTQSIGRTVIPATSSSRLVLPNYWADQETGIGHQIQVEVPMERMGSYQAVRDLPLDINGGAVPLDRVAKVIPTTMLGEIDRYNMQRVVTISANLHGIDLGHAAREIDQVLSPLKAERPRGVALDVRGQVAPMIQIFDGLRLGLILAVVCIFLLLAANFQSMILALVVVSGVPAVVAGVCVMLHLTGTTLNIESFMGAIMSIGVSVANSILMVTFAERLRKESGNATKAAVDGAQSRLRPILMTTGAMVVGMIPMALGHGDSGQQSAPLGRAVIGGLLLSTVSTLFILPFVFSAAQNRRTTDSASIDPTDPESRYAGA